MKTTKTIHDDQYIKLIGQITLERKRLGLSQEEVASIVDMTQSEISKIETLERRLDVLEFRQLLQVYRITGNQKLRQLVLGFLGLPVV